MSSLEELAFSEIRPFIRRGVQVFDESEKVSRVYGELKEKDHYEALVKSGDRYGLTTVADLLEVSQPSQTTIGDYPKDLWGVYPDVPSDASVLDVVETMLTNRVRALPVVDDGKLEGIISQEDVAWALEGLPELRGVKTAEIMVTPVITLGRYESVAKARSTMMENRISFIPVVDEENRAVGMVSAKALVYSFVRPIGARTVGERGGLSFPRWGGMLHQVMEDPLVEVDHDEPVSRIISLMKEAEAYYCIVNDPRDQVAGIITPRELLSLVLRYLPEEELPVYIMGLSADEEWFDMAVASDKIRRVMKRAQRIHPHISEVRVDVEKQRDRGTRTLYSVRANIFSRVPAEAIHVRAEGWDLLQVFDGLTDALNKRFRETKHEPRRVDRYKPLSRRTRRRG